MPSHYYCLYRQDIDVTFGVLRQKYDQYFYTSGYFQTPSVSSRVHTVHQYFTRGFPAVTCRVKNGVSATSSARSHSNTPTVPTGTVGALGDPTVQPVHLGYREQSRAKTNVPVFLRSSPLQLGCLHTGCPRTDTQPESPPWRKVGHTARRVVGS